MASSDKEIEVSESIDEENSKWFSEDAMANYINDCFRNYETYCKKLQVMEIPGKGKGLVALQDIKKHRFICEYEGTLITYNEGIQREKEYEKDETTTMSYMFLFSHNNQRYWVDATNSNSGIGRFINHDLNPNTEIKCIECDGKPRLIVMSIKAIYKGYEISYDYGDRRTDIIRSYPFLNFRTQEEESRRVTQNRQYDETEPTTSSGGERSA